MEDPHENHTSVTQCDWAFLDKYVLNNNNNNNNNNKHAETTPGFAVIVDKIEEQEQLCCVTGKYNKGCHKQETQHLQSQEASSFPGPFPYPVPPPRRKDPGNEDAKEGVDRLLREFCSIFIRKICLRLRAILKVSHRVPADQKNRFSISETSEFSSTFDPTDEIN